MRSTLRQVGVVLCGNLFQRLSCLSDRVFRLDEDEDDLRGYERGSTVERGWGYPQQDPLSLIIGDIDEGVSRQWCPKYIPQLSSPSGSPGGGLPGQP
jgi:hypothetical protein